MVQVPDPWFAGLRDKADNHEPGEAYRVEVWQSDLTRLLDIAEGVLVSRSCTCGGISAVPHATDHTSDCAIWDDQPPAFMPTPEWKRWR